MGAAMGDDDEPEVLTVADLGEVLAVPPATPASSITGIDLPSDAQPKIALVAADGAAEVVPAGSISPLAPPPRRRRVVTAESSPKQPISIAITALQEVHQRLADATAVQGDALAMRVHHLAPALRQQLARVLDLMPR